MIKYEQLLILDEDTTYVGYPRTASLRVFTHSSGLLT